MCLHLWLRNLLSTTSIHHGLHLLHLLKLHVLHLIHLLINGLNLHDASHSHSLSFSHTHARALSLAIDSQPLKLSVLSHSLPWYVHCLRSLLFCHVIFQIIEHAIEIYCVQLHGHLGRWVLCIVYHGRSLLDIIYLTCLDSIPLIYSDFFTV